MAQGAERHFGAVRYDANMANLVLLFQRPRANFVQNARTAFGRTICVRPKDDKLSASNPLSAHQPSEEMKLLTLGQKVSQV
jgi:hypothetical protein